MYGEPGEETSTPDLEAKLSQLGGTIFGGQTSSLSKPTLPDWDKQVIKFFSTRAIGNRKYPLNVKFPELYDFDPGHVLTAEQLVKIIPQQQLVGDFDGNNRVELDDFFAFAEAFNKKATGDNARFDLDGDGFVGFGDFFIFADNFGKKR